MKTNFASCSNRAECCKMLQWVGQEKDGRRSSWQGEKLPYDPANRQKRMRIESMSQTIKVFFSGSKVSVAHSRLGQNMIKNKGGASSVTSWAGMHVRVLYYPSWRGPCQLPGHGGAPHVISVSAERSRSRSHVTVTTCCPSCCCF